MNNVDLILNSMLDGVLLLSGSGNVLLANQAIKDMFSAVDGEFFLGKKLAQKGLERDFSHFIREVVFKPEERLGEFDLPEKNISVSVSAIPVADDGDTNLLFIVKNITKQRQLEKVRRDFIANASHELKTPITGIRLLAEALCQSAGDTVANTRFAHSLQKETQRLAQLVNDLLDLSKLEAIEPKFEYFNLVVLIEELYEEYKNKAKAAGITIDFRVSDDPPQFYGNPEQMELMVSNLLENAVRYTPTDGSIEVDLGFKKNQFTIVVIDSGIGIPDKDLNRIFERFYRVDKARSRKSGGTGLGLSIVKHVVQNHQGRIKVDSRLNAGSKFTVRLPLLN